MPVPPPDEWERELRAAVAPSDWHNPSPQGRYNLVVVGAGTAGLVCAAGAAGLGARVALVEKHRLGGDCLNFGCVPSKALLRCARAAAATRRAGEFGVVLPGPVEVDFAAVMERMRRLRAGISHHDAAVRFRGMGVDVFLGSGRFTGPDRLEVAGQTLRFARAVIATGSTPAPLDLPGLAALGPLTNETVFDLTELPRRLAVIGAGPVGCELAQAFRRLGSTIHLVHRWPRLLPREEPEAVAVLQRRFEREGVQLHLGAKPLAGEVEDGPGGPQRILVIEENGQPVRLAVDTVLVAVGRRPNIEGLNLEAAGVRHGTSGVVVNDSLRTTNSRIYAAGDVCSAYRFTHAADAMARLVLRNALFFGRTRVSELVIPWCTYTEPEVAHVGLTAAQAREQGLEAQTLRMPLYEVDRAILDGETEGFAAVLTREGSDHILGATVVAEDAGDLIAPLVLAMTAGLGLAALSRTVLPYPTQAEALKRLGDAYQKGRLTPGVAGLLRRFLSWRR